MYNFCKIYIHNVRVWAGLCASLKTASKIDPKDIHT